MRSRRRGVVWVLALASAMTFAVAESGYAQAQNTGQNPDDGSQQPPAPQSDPATNEPTHPRPELTRRPVAPAASSAAKPEDQPAGPKVEIPTGTHIALVLNNAVSTRSAKPGDPVYFETIYPVMVGGKVAIPAGSWVSGEVTESKRAGRVKGRAELMVRLTTMILPNAYTVNLAAAPSGAGTGGGETVDNEGKVIGDSNKAS